MCAYLLIHQVTRSKSICYPPTRLDHDENKKYSLEESSQLLFSEGKASSVQLRCTVLVMGGGGTPTPSELIPPQEILSYVTLEIRLCPILSWCCVKQQFYKLCLSLGDSIAQVVLTTF